MLFNRIIKGFETLVQVRLCEPRQPERTLQIGLGKHAVHKEHRFVTIQLCTSDPAIFVFM